MVSELSETSHGVGSQPNLYVHDYAYVWRGLAWTWVMCLAPSIDEWIWAELGIEYSKLWICLLEKCVACSTELTCTYWMNFSIYQEWIWPFLFKDFDTLIYGGWGLDFAISLWRVRDGGTLPSKRVVYCHLKNKEKYILSNTYDDDFLKFFPMTFFFL